LNKLEETMSWATEKIKEQALENGKLKQRIAELGASLKDCADCLDMQEGYEPFDTAIELLKPAASKGGSMEIITHVEIGVTVHADYQPHEPETLESPAVEADIENIYVFKDGKDITFLLSKEQLESIKSQLWEELHKQRSGISQ
jgi:hypothetical protein